MEYDRMQKEKEIIAIEGRNALFEALKSDLSIIKVFTLTSARDELTPLSNLVSKCIEGGSKVEYVSRMTLDKMSTTGSHQGIIAHVSGISYTDVRDIVAKAKNSGRPALIVLCDHIEDPRNLGAVVRCAEAAGAHGVIIPKRRGAGFTTTAIKASAGAAFHLPIARCTNISTTIDMLKKDNIWIYGADASGDTTYFETDLTGPMALVMGAEGTGLSRLVREKCDFLINIPMFGKTDSLNVSAASAVLLFEAVRQRTMK